MKARIENDVLIIEVPVTRSVSKSGKSITIATTGGNKVTDVMVDGKPSTVGVNAYISKS